MDVEWVEVERVDVWLFLAISSCDVSCEGLATGCTNLLFIVLDI